MSLTPENRTVTGYEAEFTKLSRYALHLFNDKNRKARMLETGLKLGIRHKVAPFDSLTFEEVFQACPIVENEFVEFQNSKEKENKQRKGIKVK